MDRQSTAYLFRWAVPPPSGHHYLHPRPAGRFTVNKTKTLNRQAVPYHLVHSPIHPSPVRIKPLSPLPPPPPPPPPQLCHRPVASPQTSSASSTPTVSASPLNLLPSPSPRSQQREANRSTLKLKAEALILIVSVLSLVPGYLVLGSFSSAEEVQVMRGRIAELVDGFDGANTTVFSTKDHVCRDEKRIFSHPALLFFVVSFPE